MPDVILLVQRCKLLPLLLRAGAADRAKVDLEIESSYFKLLRLK